MSGSFGGGGTGSGDCNCRKSSFADNDVTGFLTVPIVLAAIAAGVLFLQVQLVLGFDSCCLQ